MTTAFEGSYGLRLSLLRHITIISIFPVIVAKMETITKWMLVLPPPLSQCCLGKKRELYTLVFRPRQLWIGGGEGSYFFYFGGDGSLAQKWQNRLNFLIRFVLCCRLEYFTAPIFLSFFQPLLKHHMSATIPLHQAVCTSSGIRFPNMRTTVIYSVTPFTIIPLVITMEDGRTSVRQQQATLSQAFAREPNMRFGLLHSLW